MSTYGGKTRTYRKEELSLEFPQLLEYVRYELSRHHHIQLKMSGSSMRPTIEDGDVVTIVPVEATTIHPQDIVLLATSSGTALIRRVLSVETRDGTLYAITQGDHAKRPDTPIPLTRIIGRVVSLQRKGRGKTIPLGSSLPLRTRLWMWLKRWWRQKERH